MAMSGKWDAKDPSDIRDYWLDLTNELASSGALIDSIDITVPDDIELVDSDYNNTAQTDAGVRKMIRTRFSGGVDKGKYGIDYSVMLSTGEVYSGTAVLQVKERVIK